MRYFLFFLISLPVVAVEYKGPCSKLAMNHALKGHRQAVRDFSIKLSPSDLPPELEVYEIAYRENKKFYHGEVTVERIRGRCQSPVLQYVTLLE